MTEQRENWVVEDTTRFLQIAIRQEQELQPFMKVEGFFNFLCTVDGERCRENRFGVVFWG